jgi:hypothetical protein
MNDVDDADAVAFVITYLICVELSKEPEYKCEYCDKVYKQEARYITHIGGCIEKDTRPMAGRIEKDTPLPMPPPPPMLDNTTVMELLRQNGEMLELLRKQQETIQMLVARQMER